jgi:hypothetical protein
MTTLVLMLAMSARARIGAEKPDTPLKPSEEKIVQIEKDLWEGWKNHDLAPFKKVIPPESIDVTAEGIMGADEMLKTIGSSECTVNSYSIEGAKVTWLNKTTALLTYKGNQDAICGGQKAPAAVWASSIWVNQKGEWKNVFHQETPAAPAMPAMDKKTE